MWVISQDNELVNLNSVGAIVRDGNSAFAIVGNERIRLADTAAVEVSFKIADLLEGEEAWRTNHVVNLQPLIEKARIEFEEAEKQREERRARLYAANGVPDTPIEKCGFSTRTTTALQRTGITTLKQAAMWTKDELANIRNFGSQSQDELHHALTSTQQGVAADRLQPCAPSSLRASGGG